MPASEDDLIKRAIEGDSDSLRDILKIHAPNIRLHIAQNISRRWRSLLSEDDVMQQTYADVIHAIKRFVPVGEGSFRGWLKKLAVCNLKDAIKMLEAQKRGGDLRRIDMVQRGASYVTLLRVLSASGQSPTQEVSSKEVQSILNHAVQKLPELYSKVIRMYDLECLSIDEVAKTLNRSTGAVYMLRARAHDRMRDILGDTSQYFTKAS